MPDRRSSKASLSARVTLLTVAVLAVAVVVIAAICLAGVYSLALSENDARLQANRQLLVDDLASRLTVADRVAQALAAEAGTRAPSAAVLERAVAQSAGSNAEYFALLMFVDAQGHVLAASPADAASTSPAPADLFRDRGSTDAYFSWVRPPGKAPALWVVRHLAGSASGARVIGQIRTGFMSRLVDDVTQGRGAVTAFIVDGSRRPVVIGVGSPPLDVASVSYGKADAQGRGIAKIGSSETGALTGYYSPVTAPAPGLDWQVVVLASEGDALARSWGALVPAGLATILVAFIAVAFVLVYSRRLIAPLTELERRAREVASGGHVRALAVERDDELGRMAEAFNEMGVRLNSLQDMAQLLASSSSLPDVLDAVLAAVGHILGTGESAIMLADEPGPALSLVRGHGLAEPAATMMVTLDSASPVIDAFEHQAPVTFFGSMEEGAAAIHRLFGADGPRAGVVVPLMSGRRALGVIVVLAPAGKTFTEAQIATLRAFSANAAVAVHNTRLFEEERVSRRQAEALREVAELIVRPADLDQALDRAAAVAADLLGKESWAYGIEGREQLGLADAEDELAGRKLIQAWRLAARSESWDPSTRSEPVDIPDVRAIDGLWGLLGANVGSAVFIPIVVGSSVRGVLALLGRERRPVALPRRFLLAGTIGRELSLAIRNSYLFQQARSRAANLETVYRISQAVSSELQLNIVLNRVLDVVQKIFSADAVALMMNDAQRRIMTTSMARGVTSRELLYFQVRPGEDVAGEVFETHTPVLHRDLERVSTPMARLAVDQGLRSLIVVPLVARGKALGVLSVFACATDAFSSEDADLMLTFATQAALAIDTATLYGKEHHVASVLQSSILPERLPEIPGIETASFYLPVGADAEIGGDYYDVFPTADGRIVLVIADVCGKGVLAATKTSMVKYSLRGLIAAGAGPAAALEELNRLVALSGDPADIVTAWVGVLELRTRRLTYANGGHPPALLWAPGKRRLRRLVPTGPLLGAVRGVVFEEHTVSVGAGDTLLLYTDGITEARKGSEFFGEERIQAVIREGADPGQAVETLLAAVREFSGGGLRDDAAALLVRIDGDDAGADV